MFCKVPPRPSHVRFGCLRLRICFLVISNIKSQILTWRRMWARCERIIIYRGKRGRVGNKLNDQTFSIWVTVCGSGHNYPMDAWIIIHVIGWIKEQRSHLKVFEVNKLVKILPWKRFVQKSFKILNFNLALPRAHITGTEIYSVAKKTVGQLIKFYFLALIAVD